MKTLKIGDEGPDVERLQQALIELGHPLVADGDFGPKTRSRVMAFQKAQGLTFDGVVGKSTWAALRHVPRPLGSVDPEEHAWATIERPAFDQAPSKPEFGPIVGNHGRQQVFGKFRYAPAPTAGNPEGIRFLDDWPDRNIVTVEVPQLAKIPGIDHHGRRVGQASPRVQVHRLVADQMVALWSAWEDAGVLDRVITWAGMWSPRFIRGSRSVLSNHAFATAFDINAPWNGLGREPARRGERGSVWDLVPIAHEHGFYWGGHFRRKDGMHFEVAKVM